MEPAGADHHGRPKLDRVHGAAAQDGADACAALEVSRRIARRHHAAEVHDPPDARSLRCAQDRLRLAPLTLGVVRVTAAHPVDEVQRSIAASQRGRERLRSLEIELHPRPIGMLHRRLGDRARGTAHGVTVGRECDRGVPTDKTAGACQEDCTLSTS